MFRLRPRLNPRSHPTPLASPFKSRHCFKAPSHSKLRSVIKHTSRRLFPPQLHPSVLLNGIHLQAWQPHTALLCAPNVRGVLSLARGLGVIQDDTIVFSDPGRSRFADKSRLQNRLGSFLCLLSPDVSRVNWRESDSEGDRVLEWGTKWTGIEIKSWWIGWVMVSLGADGKRNPTVDVYENVTNV